MLTRPQAVRYRSTTSIPQTLTCGVPQGVRKGSLCFLIPINDAVNDKSHRWKCVADSAIAADVNSASPDSRQLQDTTCSLQQWVLTNDVTISTAKAVAMHDNFGAHNTVLPTITLGPDILQVVITTKLPGVPSHNEPTWKAHLTTVTKAHTCTLNLLRRLKSLGVPFCEQRHTDKICILPWLKYTFPPWSSYLTATQRDLPAGVQKRACETIPGTSYTS